MSFNAHLKPVALAVLAILNVENLFDRMYFQTADANKNISPGAPRNARLTLDTTL